MKLQEALPQEAVLTLADGKNYTFSEFHLNAQSAIEERYNMSFVALNGEDSQRVGYEFFLNDLLLKKVGVWKFLAFQLLRYRHRDITEEDILLNKEDKIFYNIISGNLIFHGPEKYVEIVKKCRK